MKKLPFKVPEGYFDDLAERMDMEVSSSGRTAKARSAGHVHLSWCAGAVAAAAVLIAGIFFAPEFFRQGSDDSDALYMELLYSDLIPMSDPDLLFMDADDYEDEYGQEESLTEDDIMEYLINSGVSAEYAMLTIEAGNVK